MVMLGIILYRLEMVEQRSYYVIETNWRQSSFCEKRILRKIYKQARRESNVVRVSTAIVIAACLLVHRWNKHSPESTSLLIDNKGTRPALDDKSSCRVCTKINRFTYRSMLQHKHVSVITAGVLLACSSGCSFNGYLTLFRWRLVAVVVLSGCMQFYHVLEFEILQLVISTGIKKSLLHFLRNTLITKNRKIVIGILFQSAAFPCCQ